jgi:hypothetical protein
MEYREFQPTNWSLDEPADWGKKLSELAQI